MRTSLNTEPWESPSGKWKVKDVEATQRPEEGREEEQEAVVFRKPEISRNLKGLTSVRAISVE